LVVLAALWGARFLFTRIAAPVLGRLAAMALLNATTQLFGTFGALIWLHEAITRAKATNAWRSTYRAQSDQSRQTRREAQSAGRRGRGPLAVVIAGANVHATKLLAAIPVRLRAGPLQLPRWSWALTIPLAWFEPA
jgi:hypothetical protein